MSSRISASLLLALGLVTACSSSDDEGSGALPDSAVQAYAGARCDQIERCTPLVIPLSFRDKAACVASLVAGLKEEIALRGVAIGESEAAACSAKLGTLACDDPTTPVECRFTGLLPNDQPCASGLQCSSGQCFLDGGTAAATSYCGVCKAFVPEGGDCTSASCETGLGCNSANRCIRGASAGAACTDAFDCFGNLQCVGSKCTAPLQQGAACAIGNTSAGACETGKNLFCTPATANAEAGTCEPATFAAIGAACGYDAAAARFVLCNGGQCTNIDGSTGKGTCTAALAEGAACTTGDDLAATCAFGLECTSGVCAKPLLATCNP